MDRSLHEAALRGDMTKILELIREDDTIIEQTTYLSANTALHIAAKFGHVELVTEMVKLRPEMVSVENEKMETPIHEACREGHVEVLKLLLEVDPWLAYKVNHENESILCVASWRGNLEVVKYLLNCYPLLLTLEEDSFTTSLHMAASAGHSDIAKEILKTRPDFAFKKDIPGCSPLHIACSKGHLEITRELLRLDPDLSALQDDEGRTPLHWAAIKGRVNILDEILSTSLESALMLTKRGETVLHLGVKNIQYEAIRYLVETINTTDLVNLPDNDGNTILHLATAGKLTTMVTYIVNKTGIDVNILNRKGFTALDVVQSDASNSGALLLIPTIEGVGGKRSDQLPPQSPQIRRIIQTPSRRSHLYSPNKQSPMMKKIMDSRGNSHRRPRHNRREKQSEHNNEGLRNARNTITIVAVLIATVTFAAGINPPGGFKQDGQFIGKAALGTKTPFKVFMVCNHVALFLSLGIVIILVSVIPFRRRPMMKLLMITHKVMWVSLSFMAAAYLAATWAIMPRVKGTKWMLDTEISVGVGCMVLTFVGLGVMLGRHWLRKWEWRKKREKRKESPSPDSSVSRVVEDLPTIKKKRSVSTNSDIESSDKEGIYPL